MVASWEGDSVVASRWEGDSVVEYPCKAMDSGEHGCEGSGMLMAGGSTGWQEKLAVGGHSQPGS